jgi:ATP-binding cassette subfamily B protein/subfamily B ATP-binding cassette protein MsbA
MSTIEGAPAVSSWRRQLRLLRYARPHWRGLAVLIATMLANIGLDLLRPWPLKLVIDNVLGDERIPGVLRSLPGVDGPHGLLLWVAIATVLIFLLGTATQMAYTYCSLLMGQRMTFSLATDLFAHLQRLSVLFHTRRQVGDLIARVTGDAWCVNTIVTDAIVPAVQALVTLIAMFFVMWQLQPTLTLLALGVAPFFIIVIKVLGGPIKDRNREQRDLEGSMMSVVEQSLSSVPAIQAFTREEHEVRRFRSYADRTVLAYVRSTVAGLWFELFAGLVTTIGTAGVIYVGADLALRGELTPGTIIVFLSYLSSLYEPLNSITQTAPTIQAAAAEADRVSEILEIEPAITDRRHAKEARVTGPIRFESVTFGYEPGRPVLHDVSFEARPGDTVAIVGPTGAGKTTMMNLLVRFFDPWEGAITIDGTDLRDMRHVSLRRQIGMVLQDPFIFPVTVAENIAYGRPDASRADIEAAAVAANAQVFIGRLPEGYNTVVGERGATLSGGEKQRLSIARAFLKDAPVLILDEPTSALDARTEGALLEALERLMHERISFVVAHRLSTIRAATRILVLDEGRIVESGSHDELLELRGLYSALYRRQMDLADHDSSSTVAPESA